MLKEKYPDKKIIFGSHSLGGSILKGVMERFKNDDKLSGHAYNSWIGSLKKDARVKDYNTPLDIVSTASGILHSIAHATEDNKVWGREKANELTFKELDIIRESFQTSLEGLYHQRVLYPEISEEE